MIAEQTTITQLEPQTLGAEHATNSALGTTTDTTSAQEKITHKATYTVDKYRLQQAAAKLLPTERVSACMRSIVPGKTNVPVFHNKHASTASYGNLMRCASPWTCPVCASAISEVRRRELTCAVDNWRGHAVMLTFTLRHNRREELKPLVQSFQSTYSAMKVGRWFQDIKREYSWFGSVRSLETTWSSRNGWHPHIHELVFLDYSPSKHDLETLRDAFRKRWAHQLKRHGRDADWEIGVDLTDDNGYIAEYIAKWGRPPAEQNQWTVAHEIAKSTVKQAKTSDGRTPFQLLKDYADTRDKQAGALFVEYANAFKGRNQIVWSRGLKDALNMPDMSDERVSAEDHEDSEELTIIDYFNWSLVCEMRGRGELLRIAATGRESDIWEYIYSLQELREKIHENPKRKHKKRDWMSRKAKHQ